VLNVDDDEQEGCGNAWWRAFLPIGDTWWNWSKRGIQFSSFQKLADDRSAEGFTVVQIFFAGNLAVRPA
jgi:hypothetical protein